MTIGAISIDGIAYLVAPCGCMLRMRATATDIIEYVDHAVNKTPCEDGRYDKSEGQAVIGESNTGGRDRAPVRLNPTAGEFEHEPDCQCYDCRPGLHED